MKKLFLILFLISIPMTVYSETKDKCETKLGKLHPSCALKKMKAFSSKHKTIGTTLGIDKKDYQKWKDTTQGKKTTEDVKKKP